VAEQQIVGLGGAAEGDEEATKRLIAHVVGVAGKDAPRVCVVPTASAESAEVVLGIYGLLPPEAVPSCARFIPWPPADLRELILEQDVIFVCGGNTANMLAVWRVHGLDRILREAWEAGIVLTGWSAGMICWFEAGVTDSFGPQLAGMECLGFLRGSACPHYDGEELRRPRYAELLRDGFPSGVAIDDDVAVRFDGTDLAEVVTARDGATAYRVARDGEEPLEARLLT
jgi:peptidase E